MPRMNVSDENENKEPGPNNNVYKLITAEEKRQADRDIAEKMKRLSDFVIALEKPPHRKAVSEKLIPELYSEIEASVQQIIRASNFVSLSADGWDDRRKRKLINGIVHQPTPILYKTIDTGINAHTGN
uniref:Uncharacterized protein n=1 Tax=Acrobeloides nanus TaxID=290746 RepID=A0A914CGX5_9BILA